MNGEWRRSGKKEEGGAGAGRTEEGPVWEAQLHQN